MGEFYEAQNYHEDLNNIEAVQQLSVLDAAKHMIFDEIIDKLEYIQDWPEEILDRQDTAAYLTEMIAGQLYHWDLLK